MVLKVLQLQLPKWYEFNSSDNFWQYPGKKCSCKAEGWKVGTTVGPCVPIILCAVLTYLDLVVEQNWWMKVVATKEDFEKLQVLCRVLNVTCGNILVSLCHEMKEKR